MEGVIANGSKQGLNRGTDISPAGLRKKWTKTSITRHSCIMHPEEYIIPILNKDIVQSHLVREVTSWHKRSYRTIQCFFKLSIKISVKYVEFVSEIFSTQSVPFDVPAEQHQGKNTEYLLIPPWK